MSHTPNLPPFMTELVARTKDIFEHRIQMSRVRTYPPDARFVTTTIEGKPGRRFIQDSSCQVMVSGRDLADMRLELGSPGFFGAFIDPMIHLICDEVEKAKIDLGPEGTVILSGTFPEKIQDTAPYHWHTVVDCGGLPVLIYTFVYDGALFFRFQVRLAISQE